MRLGALTAAVAILTATTFPSTAEAQIGGLVRKAKDAATKKAADETGVNAALEGEDVKFTDVIVELTPETLDKVITGLRASREQLGGRPALVTRRDAANKRLEELNSRNGAAIEALRQKRQAIQDCRRDSLDARKKANEDDLGRRSMTDADLRQKITDIATRVGAAQMASDTAALRKLEAEMMGLVAPTAADSAAVDKACGTPPPPSAAEKEITALQEQVSGMDSQLRSMEESAVTAGAKASGLQPLPFAMAQERLELWLAKAKGNSKQRGFTTNELKAINARRGDIEKAM